MIAVAKTSAALEQIYRFRASIEPAALLEPTFELNRRAAAEQRCVQEGLLSGNIERLSADRLVLTGAIFHEEIVRMSGNSFSFQAVVRANRMRRLLDYRTVVDRARFYDQAREHLQMLDLLERGENLECSYVLKRHLVGALASKSDLTDIPRNPAELSSL
jgi:DNA-binding GntR family transcriptional regulator